MASENRLFLMSEEMRWNKQLVAAWLVGTPKNCGALKENSLQATPGTSSGKFQKKFLHCFPVQTYISVQPKFFGMNVRDHWAHSEKYCTLIYIFNLSAALVDAGTGRRVKLSMNGTTIHYTLYRISSLVVQTMEDGISTLFTGI